MLGNLLVLPRQKTRGESYEVSSYDWMHKRTIPVSDVGTMVKADGEKHSSLPDLRPDAPKL
jgi:hypothetical protein